MIQAWLIEPEEYRSGCWTGRIQVWLLNQKNTGPAVEPEEYRSGCLTRRIQAGCSTTALETDVQTVSCYGVHICPETDVQTVACYGVQICPETQYDARCSQVFWCRCLRLKEGDPRSINSSETFPKRCKHKTFLIRNVISSQIFLRIGFQHLLFNYENKTFNC